MRTALGTGMILLAVTAALVGAGVASGHSVNYVSADAQVTPDGAVLVEAAFTEESGWAVIHERTSDGGYGEALGATRLPRRNAFYTDIEVTIEGEVWGNWTTREVVVVLHGENGDGEFTSEDPPLGGFGAIVTDRFTVEQGDRVVVTGEDDFPQRPGEPTVTVRRAMLPERGHLVVRNRTADGRIIGTRTLDAGRYENVSVPVNASFYETTGGSFAARVSLHRADDERLDGNEPAFRAGNESVATRFSVEPERAGGAVTTPVPTTAPPAGDERNTTGAIDADSGTETDGQSGFGPPIAVVALVAASIAAARST
jgi:PGF-CTERM protein